MRRRRLVISLAVLLPVSIEQASLIAAGIDETRLVTLRGNTHPLAQPQYDRGPADPALPTGRLLLLLRRPAERAAALEQFLHDVHTRGSAEYHHWLTPVEFGARFGPSDDDIHVVTQWLRGKAFHVARVSKSKMLVEFSGNLGQLHEAFHTQIRQYLVSGELHYANATDPQIPQALTAIIRGIPALHDFRAKPQIRIAGSASFDPATGRYIPDLTLMGSNGPFYGLGPQDFATQYDVSGLYAAGVNGAGKTIGIINDSNINLSPVSAYRNIFELSGPLVAVVLDGGDPGMNGDAVEAYLDVEVAGGVAPGANVNLYIAAFDTLDDPLILAAVRAIEDNQADVLSMSFSNCEAALGASHNQIVNELWQQAAAAGQSVFVSAGDSGAAGCDPDGSTPASNGFGVNGLASTPWNVAVGGADFYYSDYAKGAPSAASQWNVSNTGQGGSLKAPLPEQVWNDAFGFNAVTGQTVVASGGGGVSTVYPQPGWQSGSGTAANGYREIPDVSLFAADGANLSGYPICIQPGDCIRSQDGGYRIAIIGGTSASTPAMAGLMALIDQQYGRQGQPTFTLYPLARQAPGAFHDITLGGNNVPCVESSPECVLGTTGTDSGQYTLSGFAAAAGYDLASGLGSIDAQVLFDHWTDVSYLPTSTSLQLSSEPVQHGTPVTVNVDVTSASGTPSGTVSLLTTSALPSYQNAASLPLGVGASASTSIDSLPGGSYKLFARYSGDGVYAASTSAPVALMVMPEASSIGISAVQMVNAPGPHNAAVCFAEMGQSDMAVPSGSTVAAGQVLWLSVQPAGSVSGPGLATGSVAFTFDGQPAAAIPLSVAGIATWTTPAAAPAGNHTVTASYSGDASYSPSKSAPYTYTVQQAAPVLYISPGGACGVGTTCTAYAGDIVPIEVFLDGYACVPLTGSVNVSVGSETQTVSLAPAGSQTAYVNWALTGIAQFTGLQPGTYPVTATYSGDANYKAASVSGFQVAVTAASGQRIPTTTSISETTGALIYNQGNTTFTVTVTGNNSSGVPTGSVSVYANGEGVANLSLTQSGANSAAATSELEPWNAFSIGLNQITAVYSGDGTYQASVSTPIVLSVVIPDTPDFTMTPEAPMLVVKERTSSTVTIDLASAFGFIGTVSLSCTPSSTAIGCAVTPGSFTLDGTATATLEVSGFPAPRTAEQDGRISLLITGTSGEIVHNARITVIVEENRQPGRGIRG